ncbi:MAG: hypothetical protein Q4B08_15210 [Propionibacteriaceae bacterium]|nr:hypothetical protein [Propionibacteriaceae bacterium]
MFENVELTVLLETISGMTGIISAGGVLIGHRPTAGQHTWLCRLWPQTCRH